MKFKLSCFHPEFSNFWRRKSWFLSRYHFNTGRLGTVLGHIQAWLNPFLAQKTSDIFTIRNLGTYFEEKKRTLSVFRRGELIYFGGVLVLHVLECFPATEFWWGTPSPKVSCCPAGTWAFRLNLAGFFRSTGSLYLVGHACKRPGSVPSNPVLMIYPFPKS